MSWSSPRLRSPRLARLAPIALAVAAMAPLLTGSSEPGVPSEPICDAGGPYVAECNGSITSIQLDGTGSYDPSGGPIQFKWGVTCPSSWLDDPTSPTPTLFVDMTGVCAGTCSRARLMVTSHTGVSWCNTQISYLDTVPPVLTCPPDITITANQPTDPTKTGFATATDGCNPSPAVTWVDLGTPLTIGVGSSTISRVWTADDGCQKTTCVQTITVIPFIQGHFDIQPLACPNPFPLGEAPLAVLPASILGNEIDVTDVDPTTVFISRLNVEVPGGKKPGMGGGGLPWDRVRPVSIAIADSETPFDGPNLCDCTAVGPDGILDMDLQFDRLHLIQAFELANEPPGTEVPLEINGQLFDGSPFKAVDCILIL